jgi:hypothetical protein
MGNGKEAKSGCKKEKAVASSSRLSGNKGKSLLLITY